MRFYSSISLWLHCMHFLSLIAIFKNEAMNMREFIDHYLWQGVDHLYLIDNGSTDDYRTITAPYEKRGIVTIVEKPEPNKHLEHVNVVFRDLNLARETRWIVSVDLDEFWFCKDAKRTLRDVMQSVGDDITAVCTHWSVFGSNGLIRHPASLRHALVYRKKELDSFHGKCILRADKVVQLNIHFHALPSKSTVMFDDMRLALHHYINQSREFWEIVKMARGESMDHPNTRDWAFFDHIDKESHEVKDDTLARLLQKSYDKIMPGDDGWTQVSHESLSVKIGPDRTLNAIVRVESKDGFERSEVTTQQLNVGRVIVMGEPRDHSWRIKLLLHANSR